MIFRPRLTRRKLIVFGVVVAALMFMPWTLYYFFGGGAARAKALARYERLIPGMSVAQFQDLVRDENAGSLGVSTNFFLSEDQGDRTAVWITDDVFTFQVDFDRRGRLKRKYLAEARKAPLPAKLDNVMKMFGIPSGTIARSWP